MRYHFHLRERDGYLPDDEGVELASDEAAHKAAVAGARSILASEAAAGRLPLGTVIEVVNGNGRLVAEFPFRAVVAVDE
jgi:hypothetical protein